MKRIKHYKVEGKLNTVLDIFSNLERFGQVHPLIDKVEKLRSNTGNETYKIYEKPFHWFPIKITYNAQVIKPDDESISYLLSEIPYTKATINYHISQESVNLVKIQLTIEIVSKLIIQKILMNKMIAAQDTIIHSMQIKN